MATFLIPLVTGLLIILVAWAVGLLGRRVTMEPKCIICGSEHDGLPVGMAEGDDELQAMVGDDFLPAGARVCFHCRRLIREVAERARQRAARGFV